jgi:phage terminase large subunit
MLDKTSTVSVEATADHWWPPNYADKYFERARSLEYVRQNPKMVPAIIANYARGVDGCIEFIEDWLDTFDPRNVGTGRMSTMPFIMFPRQHELIRFLFALDRGARKRVDREVARHGRDLGMWRGLALVRYLPKKGTRIGWGSRKADLVDRIGDMDSIFEKMRFMMRSLPFLDAACGFDVDASMGYMKIIVEAKDASITGESGDDIGRGGRTLVLQG